MPISELARRNPIQGQTGQGKSMLNGVWDRWLAEDPARHLERIETTTDSERVKLLTERIKQLDLMHGLLVISPDYYTFACQCVIEGVEKIWACTGERRQLEPPPTLDHLTSGGTALSFLASTRIEVKRSAKRS
jgi:hypothetical protein